MNKYMNKLYILMLLSFLSIVSIYAVEKEEVSNDEVKEAVQNVRQSIENLGAAIKDKMQSRIDEIATAEESKDEAKAAALLQQLQDEADQTLQNVKNETNAAKEKFESDLKAAKSKWDKTLADLQTKHKKNVEAFKESINELNSYFRGFGEMTTRKVVEKLASPSAQESM